MSAWPIERKNERVVVVKISSNKANVITHQFMKEFAATLDKLSTENKSDAVVLTGNGTFFSAGLDLKFMAAATRDKRFGELIDYIETFDELVARLYAFPRPLVAAIEGHAIAGGTCIACCCDFRVSNGKGNFGMNEVVNGMSVPFNMLEVVRQAVPSKASRQIFLTGKVFGAKEAQQLGVVDEIVAPEQLLERAVQLATYSGKSMRAYPLIKELLQRPVRETLTKHKGATRRAMEVEYGLKSKL